MPNCEEADGVGIRFCTSSAIYSGKSGKIEAYEIAMVVANMGFDGYQLRIGQRHRSGGGGGGGGSSGDGGGGGGSSGGGGGGMSKEMQTRG